MAGLLKWKKIPHHQNGMGGLLKWKKIPHHQKWKKIQKLVVPQTRRAEMNTVKIWKLHLVEVAYQ